MEPQRIEIKFNEGSIFIEVTSTDKRLDYVKGYLEWRISEMLTQIENETPGLKDETHQDIA